MTADAGRGAPPPPYASFYRGKRICVTGGAGFIGSHLVDALLHHGSIVAVLDDFSNGRAENLAHHGSHHNSKVRLIRGSILDDAKLKDALAGCEIIFHQAAMCSVPGSVDRPLPTHEVNATGTNHVLEAARHAGVKRVVYAASGGSAYGNSPQLPKIETMLPEPLSPYAVSKCAGEYMMRTYAYCYGLSTISLRYFNIFGARQRADSPYAAVIPRFAQAMAKGQPVTIFGDGSQTRDFTHVSNVVHANLLAGASDKTLMGEVVNIACGASYSLLELVAAMGRVLKVKPQCKFEPARVGEVLHSRAAIDAAKALLGYQPITDFDHGLSQTVLALIEG